MCTVTILNHGTARVITMNRDEQKSRSAELPPSYFDKSDVFAPRDGNAGGTWTGVNDRGIFACLLNSYVAKTACANPPSRGLVIPAILKSAEPFITVETCNFSAYMPFRLILGDISQAFFYHWNGQYLSKETLNLTSGVMISSSSWQEQAVLTVRHQAFTAWQAAGSAFDELGLPSIHRFQPKDNAESGILVSRPNTHTTSITQIVLANDTSSPQMRYHPAQNLNPIASF